MVKTIQNKIFLIRKNDSRCFFGGLCSYYIFNCLFILLSKEGIHFDSNPGITNVHIDHCWFENSNKLKERWGFIQAWKANGAVYDDFTSFKPTKEEVLEDRIANKNW